MKKILTLTISVMLLFSFTKAQDTMYVHQQGGDVHKYAISIIDSITFYADTTTSSIPNCGTVTDADGNTYNTVEIGSQCWMRENLKTTQFNDNAAIPLQTNNGFWDTLSTPAYCWYDNNQAAYGNTYGALYNWHAAETGKLCPTGWHVPTDTEWTTLTDFLGGISVAGGKLKETGIVHWESPNTGATNETWFTALPGGFRGTGGNFNVINNKGYWWTFTGHATYGSSAWYRNMTKSSAQVVRHFLGKQHGFSIRCVKD
ncbi:MAG: fibrobacter succinogenes major paralogous domain-containing protein [Bacteroidota bacterium]|nr:fibrobacter succinogenes major paralogous domain-containing protein [Bacteroidota bacterium]